MKHYLPILLIILACFNANGQKSLSYTKVDTMYVFKNARIVIVKEKRDTIWNKKTVINIEETEQLIIDEDRIIKNPGTKQPGNY